MIAVTHVLRGGRPLATVAAAAALAGLALTRGGVRLGPDPARALLARLLADPPQHHHSTAARRACARTRALPTVARLHGCRHRATVPVATSGSLSLYWMSSPNAADRGDWHCASDVFEREWLAPHRAFFTAHAHDPLLTQNRELERQAWRNIVHHPGKYAQNLAANASRIFFNAPYSRRPLDLRAVVFIVPGALLLALLALSTVRLPFARGAATGKRGVRSVRRCRPRRPSADLGLRTDVDSHRPADPLVHRPGPRPDQSERWTRAEAPNLCDRHGGASPSARAPLIARGAPKRRRRRVGRRTRDRGRRRGQVRRHRRPELLGR